MGPRPIDSSLSTYTWVLDTVKPQNHTGQTLQQSRPTRKKNLTLMNLPSGTTDTSSKCQEWLQSTFEKRESCPHFKHPKDKQPNSTRAPTPARASMKLPQTEKHTDTYTDDEDGSKGQLSLEHCLLFM